MLALTVNTALGGMILFNLIERFYGQGWRSVRRVLAVVIGGAALIAGSAMLQTWSSGDTGQIVESDILGLLYAVGPLPVGLAFLGVAAVFICELWAKD